VQFKNVVAYSRRGGPLVLDTMARLRATLESMGATLWLDPNAVQAGIESEHPSKSREELGALCDLVVVIGGDGSMISGGRLYAEYDLPIVGINRGRLGFLTDVMPNDVEQAIADLLSGEYKLDARFMLSASLVRDGHELASRVALNEVVLHPGQALRMVEFELYVDGEFAYSQRSDGLIASTPTGSTAYSLSGGGPILQPNIDALILLPIFPHSLTNRPLIVDGNSEIKLVIGDSNDRDNRLSCDAQQSLQCEPGDTIYIRKHVNEVKLLHPTHHNFYDLCRSKLGWGSRLA